MALIEVKVPDIGDFAEVTVIELMVKPGDTIAAEQSLITVESDKASMEIPSSHAGVVQSLQVKLGDKVAEGTVVLMLEAAAASDLPVVAPAAPSAAITASAPPAAAFSAPAARVAAGVQFAGTATRAAGAEKAAAGGADAGIAAEGAAGEIGRAHV